MTKVRKITSAKAAAELRAELDAKLMAFADDLTERIRDLDPDFAPPTSEEEPIVIDASGGLTIGEGELEALERQFYSNAGLFAEEAAEIMGEDPNQVTPVDAPEHLITLQHQAERRYKAWVKKAQQDD